MDGETLSETLNEMILREDVITEEDAIYLPPFYWGLCEKQLIFIGTG